MVVIYGQDGSVVESIQFKRESGAPASVSDWFRPKYITGNMNWEFEHWKSYRMMFVQFERFLLIDEAPHRYMEMTYYSSDGDCNQDEGLMMILCPYLDSEASCEWSKRVPPYEGDHKCYIVYNHSGHCSAKFAEEWVEASHVEIYVSAYW